VASVRAVAADLGVAKNTAHRAMASLGRAGLIEPIQARDAGGHFRPARYLLHVGELLALEPVATPTRARQRATTTVPPAQLTLLPSA
jgi:DNA-binding IclR family transcriptional regulator